MNYETALDAGHAAGQAAGQLITQAMDELAQAQIHNRPKFEYMGTESFVEVQRAGAQGFRLVAIRQGYVTANGRHFAATFILEKPIFPDAAEVTEG